MDYSKPIRILQVIPDMRSGGVENFIMNLYRSIDREMVQFDFVVHYKEKKFLDDEIERLGGKIYRFSLRNDNNLIKYIIDLNQFYKKHREYKVVHCHWNSMGFIHLFVAKINKVYVRIGHSHNSSAGIGTKGKIKKLMVKPYKYVTTLNMACSNKAGIFLFGNKPFEFIPNAINVNKFRYSNQAREKIRNSLRLNKDDFLIGHVGRFNTQKNHRFLIEVFKQIYQLNHKAYLIMLGEGELLDTVKRQVRESGLEKNVFFAGVHSNMEDYYSAMDIFLLPSLYEGLPLTAVESQASGLDTLLSDSITKQVKINDNVYYLSNKNVRDWCDMVIKCAHGKVDRTYLNDVVERTDYNVDRLVSKVQEKYVRLYTAGQ